MKTLANRLKREPKTWAVIFYAVLAFLLILILAAPGKVL